MFVGTIGKVSIIKERGAEKEIFSIYDGRSLSIASNK